MLLLGSSRRGCGPNDVVVVGENGDLLLAQSQALLALVMRVEGLLLVSLEHTCLLLLVRLVVDGGALGRGGFRRMGTGRSCLLLLGLGEVEEYWIKKVISNFLKFNKNSFFYFIVFLILKIDFFLFLLGISNLVVCHLGSEY
jgi:hypothetical protein